MNDDVEIETLGLKDLMFIEDQIKAIESQLDEMLEEGFEKELAPEPWQDSDKRYGYLHNPDLFKQFLGLSKLRTRYEKRRRILEGIPDDEEPRMGLSPECQDAFDLGVAWANYNRQNTAPKKMPIIKKLILLEAESRWESEGDNPTPRKTLFKEFASYARKDWELIAQKHGLELPMKIKLLGIKAMETLFQSIAGKDFIKIPDGVADDGAPKK
jgi:hypothetical protein